VEAKTAAPHRTVGIWPRLLLPDLAAMLTASSLFFCLFVYDAGTVLFRDSDTGWHIRNGERILAGHALPRTDPFSFSKSGQPWFAWEWGADILMGAIYRLSGLRGLTALFALAIAAGIWLCCRLHAAAGGDYFILALLAPLTVTTASVHWLARPHVLSWLFLLAALLYAERAPARFGARQLALIAGGTALWSNLHASFFLAPVIFIIYAAAHFMRPLVWPLSRDSEWARTRWYMWAALASVAGSLLNPYGWLLYGHVFSFLTDTELTSRISEFQSFNFQQPVALQMATALGLSVAGGTLALSQKKLAHALLIALFVWGGLRSGRVLPLVALAALPLANGAFTEALYGMRGLRRELQRALDRALAYSARLRAIDRKFSGAAFLAGAALLALLPLASPAYSARIAFPPKRFPVAAAVMVEKLPAQARLLASDSFGGYLIYRFDGARQVYIDGRSDFYGAAFLKQYLALMSARPGWRDIVSSFHFTHALLPGDSPLLAALEQAGWAILYKDEVATLLEAR
jgi:hypothetical protein